MSFKVSYTGGFNPFEWEDLKCPVCGVSEFVSQDHALVLCAKCSAEFEVRMTAGDPGCVMDCFVKDIYAPLWKCADCGKEAAYFNWQDPVCPDNARHTMKRVESIWKLWDRPKGYPGSYYLILKLGEYCSGWLGADWVRNEAQRLRHPSQEQWDEFQRNNDISWPTYGARWALI